MQSKVPIRNVQILLCVSSLICLFVFVVDLVRFLMIPSETSLWDSLSSSNVQRYITLLYLKQALLGYAFISAVLCCMLAVPIAVMWNERRTFSRSKNLKPYQKFNRFLTYLPSSVIKTLLVESIILLEVSFMLTSHVLWFDNLQNFVFYQLLPLLAPSPAAVFKTWDICCLILLGAILTLSSIEFAKNDRVILPILKSLRVTALIVASLGIQIFLFDRSEFYMRVASIVSAGGLGWLTNANLFFASLAVVLATTFAIGFSNNGMIKKLFFQAN